MKEKLSKLLNSLYFFTVIVLMSGAAIVPVMAEAASRDNRQQPRPNNLPTPTATRRAHPTPTRRPTPTRPTPAKHSSSQEGTFTTSQTVSSFDSNRGGQDRPNDPNRSVDNGKGIYRNDNQRNDNNSNNWNQDRGGGRGQGGGDRGRSGYGGNSGSTVIIPVPVTPGYPGYSGYGPGYGYPGNTYPGPIAPPVPSYGYQFSFIAPAGGFIAPGQPIGVAWNSGYNSQAAGQLYLYQAGGAMIPAPYAATPGNSMSVPLSSMPAGSFTTTLRPDLPPGSYYFMMVASDGSGSFNSQPFMVQ